MGIAELITLLVILLARAQKTPAAAAEEHAAKARDAHKEAEHAKRRGDHRTAAKKKQEAAQHAQAANNALKAARTPPPWPQVVPAELPPFPSSGWKPASPVTSAMSSRAWQLLQELWKYGPGTWKAEKTADRWVVYQAQQMGDKRGVVAFTTTARVEPAAPARPSVATPAPATPAPRPPVASPAPESPAFDPMGQPMPASAPASSPGRIILTNAPASSAPSSVPTLRRGSKGPSVVWLQQHLGTPADGSFGPATETAVKHFQSSHGLTADGVVGPKTWAALGVGRGSLAA